MYVFGRSGLLPLWFTTQWYQIGADTAEVLIKDQTATLTVGAVRQKLKQNCGSRQGRN